MTERAPCRSPLRVLELLQHGNWALETSDRGGQDKARKVRAVGRGGCCLKIPAIQQTLRRIRRTLRLSGTRYHCSIFDTL
jgi:hypothetical protein